ncbi:MarR family winged helix-turn-helix transcriptional regulator [Ectobacillus ponti]|uniref:MarR family transcriptional regulator n=1 Tax=Ectobacillus ponti TaxID=2961894 RepID=A0AA42BPM7_9BACI|nr:MarR family transcriptional regulator [Ectobacillus ponti]MCP8968606.1 MarR family transcriptional regulator [Ectobacillus ponti]
MDLGTRQQLVLMVRALYFCMTEEWEEAGRSYGLSSAQQHLLFLLATADRPQTPTDISRHGCWHISTVTRLLKPLQARGLLRVYVHPENAKYKQVELTGEGRAMFGQFAKSIEHTEAFPSDFSMLTEEEAKLFLDLGSMLIRAKKGAPFVERLKARVSGLDYTDGEAFS